GGRARGRAERGDGAVFEAVRGAPDAMSISTVDEGRYRHVNASFLRLIGRGEQEVVGHTAVELGYWKDESQRQRLLARLSQGTVRDAPVTIRRPAGECREVLLSAELLDLEGEACVVGLSFAVPDPVQADA